MLLVELQHSDLTPLTSGQPEMFFNFDVGVPLSEFFILATQADVGRTFSAPDNLLPIYNEQLTRTGLIFPGMACCEGTVHRFISPPRLNEGNTGGDFVIVTRIAPNLGPNLFGYRITDVTQTIDDITITHVSDVRYNRSGAHTVRIYGVPIPEPSTWLLIIGFMLCYCFQVPVRSSV
jgi:hypothetical protein